MPVAVSKVTPVGSVPPVSVIVGAGKPLAVTVKVFGAPSVKVAVLALVNTGASSTFNVKFCVTLPAALAIVNVSAWAPAVPAAGVPLNVPVAGLNVTPVGSVPPVCVIVGTGKPVAVTVNEPATPTENDVVAALVTTGASFTVNVNDCGALA